LQGIIANYFERSLGLFAKQQDDARAKMYNPLSLMTEIAEQNINLWKDMQESFFKATIASRQEDVKDKKKDES